MKKLKGDKHRSQFINKLAFGSYLDKIENPDTVKDWITRDKEIVKQYVADEYCQNVFTLNGFETLMQIITLCNADKTFEKNTEKRYNIFKCL